MAALHIIPDWTVPYLAYMTRPRLGASSVTRLKTADSLVWRLTGLATHWSSDSLMSLTAGQMDGKAQGPEGRLMLWWAGLRESIRNILLQRKQD